MRPDAARAAALLRLWNDVALQHVSMGGACACGMGGVTLRLQDFERDILDYLRDDAGRLGEAEAHALLACHAPAGHEGAWWPCWRRWPIPRAVPPPPVRRGCWAGWTAP